MHVLRYPYASTAYYENDCAVSGSYHTELEVGKLRVLKSARLLFCSEYTKAEHSIFVFPEVESSLQLRSAFC